MAEHGQASADGLDKGLEVLECIVAGTSHVGRSEETEDILGGLGQLPELRERVSATRESSRVESWQLTEAQYASLGRMWRSSDRRKMPFLNTSLESLAPILAAQEDGIVWLVAVG